MLIAIGIGIDTERDADTHWEENAHHMVSKRGVRPCARQFWKSPNG